MEATDLTWLTSADLKLLLQNRGVLKKQCNQNKSTLINLLKSKLNELTSSFEDYTIKSLKVELKLRKLQSKGNKQQLIQQLQQFIEKENISSNNNTNINRKRNFSELSTDYSPNNPSKRRRILQSNINDNNNDKHKNESISPSLDIQVIEANKSIQCPLTQTIFTNPVKSRKCNHTFERVAIINYIQNKQKELNNINNNNFNRFQLKQIPCPILGCSHFISMRDLMIDKEMIKLIQIKSNANNSNNVDNNNKPTILDWTHLSDGDNDQYDEEQDDDDDDDDDSDDEEEDDESKSDDDDDLDLTSMITRHKILMNGEQIQIERASDYIGDFECCFKTNNKIFAQISGRSNYEYYTVKISVNNDGSLNGTCSCPSWYNWCKHIIALGLTFINNPFSFTYYHQDEEDEEEDEEEEEEDDDYPFNSIGFSLTRNKIEGYTDSISYGRAMEYIGCFEQCVKTNNCISGVIGGRSCYDEYQVSITSNDGRLCGDCTCPSYHYWCKHIAALGITFIEQPQDFESE